MSRLFDTLEQIRRNETYNAARHAKKQDGLVNSGKKISRTGILVAIALVAFAGAVLINLQTIEKFFSVSLSQTAADRNDTGLQSPQTAIPVQPVDPAIIAESHRQTSGKKNFAALNNAGVEKIRKEEYWPGIHALQKALHQHPERIEIHINLGVALAELGLYGAANEHFSKAYDIDPRHPVLLENLAILHDRGLLDKPLSFLTRQTLLSGSNKVPVDK